MSAYGKLLMHLNVGQLRSELIKRDIYFNGSKATLIEHLKKELILEGKDPTNFLFGIDDKVDDDPDEAETKKNVKKRKNDCNETELEDERTDKINENYCDKLEISKITCDEEIEYLESDNEEKGEKMFCVIPIDSQPKLAENLPELQNKDITLFFKGIESTVRKFPPLTIAQIKLKISKLIGEEEVAWAEKKEAADKKKIFK